MLLCQQRDCYEMSDSENEETLGTQGQLFPSELCNLLFESSELPYDPSVRDAVSDDSSSKSSDSSATVSYEETCPDK